MEVDTEYSDDDDDDSYCFKGRHCANKEQVQRSIKVSYKRYNAFTRGARQPGMFHY